MTTKTLIELLRAADTDGKAQVAIVLHESIDLTQASRWNIDEVTRFTNLIEINPGLPRW